MSFTVASQTLLQESSKLRVSIGHVRHFKVSEGVDDVAEGGKRFIYLFGFSQNFPFGLSFTHFFASGQVHDCDLPWFGASVLQIILMEGQNEGHMGPGGEVVHICEGYCPAADALLKYLYSLLSRWNVLLGHVLNINPFRLVFPDFQVDLARVKEVPYFFHVDLYHADFYSEFKVVWTAGYPLEDRWDAPRKEAFQIVVVTIWPHTREGLSWRSLSIGEDGAIDALESWIHYRLSYLLEDFLLLGFGGEDVIESKSVILFFDSVFIFDSDLSSALLNDEGWSLLLLLVGPDPDKNSDSVLTHFL